MKRVDCTSLRGESRKADAGEDGMRSMGRKRAAIPASVTLLAAAAMLGGCSMLGASPEGTSPDRGTLSNAGTKWQSEMAQIIGKTERAYSVRTSFGGSLAADEPLAAWVARDILQEGGNAADAAVALYFALSVTYPSAAGLGGGGICLMREKAGTPVATVSFPARAPAGGGGLAIPGNVRGFTYIHAKYGSAPLASLIAPAERMAIRGFEISRASAAQFAGLPPELGQIFGGQSLAQGATVTQPVLGAVLGMIRGRSAGGLYSGLVGIVLAQDAVAAGGALTAEELQTYQPETGGTQSVVSGDVTFALPAAGTASGALAARLWNGSEGEIAGGDAGSTSFAVIDGRGGAAACALSMNGAFGAGRAGARTGLIFAVPERSPNTVAAIATDDTGSGEVYGAAAGAGAKGAAALMKAIRNMGEDADDVRKAIGQSGEGASVNAVVCPSGAGKSCTAVSNPSGGGAGFTVNRPAS